jgi:hypothetical protein
MEEKLDIKEGKDSPENTIRKTKKKHKNNLTKNKKLIPLILLILIFIIIFIIIFKEKIFKRKQTTKYYIILIGDIGGIHSHLRLLNMTSDIDIEPIILKESNEYTVEHESLEILLKKFLFNIKEIEKPEYAIIGMPGPVENNQIITLQNIPHWKLDNGDILGEKLGLKKLVFVNDFVGNGYAIQTKLKEGVDYTFDPKLANEIPTRVCIVLSSASGDLQTVINSKNDPKLKRVVDKVVRQSPGRVKAGEESNRYNEITITTEKNTSNNVKQVVSIVKSFVESGYPVYIVEVG